MADPSQLFRTYLFLEKKNAATGLSPEELHHFQELKRQLGRNFATRPPVGAEDQRRSLRVPARLRVGFQSEGELVESLMLNLSRGGVFVATETPPPIGTTLVLRIALEDSGRRLEVPARVVSQNLDPEARQRRGMGLAFEEVPEEVQRALDALYERKLREAAGSVRRKSILRG